MDVVECECAFIAVCFCGIRSRGLLNLGVSDG